MSNVGPRTEMDKPDKYKRVRGLRNGEETPLTLY